MPLFTSSHTDIHSYKLSRPQQKYHDSQLFTLNGLSPYVLWPDLKRISSMVVIISPSPTWVLRRKTSPPKSTGHISLLVPPCVQHWKQQYSKQWALHSTNSALTKSYHSEERTPQRKLPRMLSWPPCLFPYKTERTSNRTSSSLVQNIGFFLPAPLLRKGDFLQSKCTFAGEATGLHGSKQRQERSTEENPTEISHAAETTSSSGSPGTKRAESLGKSKWHFNYDCLFYCPQVSTYSHRSEPVWPRFYFLFLLASLYLWPEIENNYLAWYPPAHLDNVFCTGKYKVIFTPFPRLLIQSQNTKSVHQTLGINLHILPHRMVWLTHRESSHRT